MRKPKKRRTALPEDMQTHTGAVGAAKPEKAPAKKTAEKQGAKAPKTTKKSNAKKGVDIKKVK